MTPQMRAFSEEIFGPGVVICRVAGADEAIELASSSAFGLGGGVCSKDPQRARDVADRLGTGMAWINSPQGWAADLPFGGTRRSGAGREPGPLGIGEFVSSKLACTPAG